MALHDGVTAGTGNPVALTGADAGGTGMADELVVRVTGLTLQVQD